MTKNRPAMEYTPTPELQPIVPAFRLRLLEDVQLDRLKSATLEILDEVGIHCPSKKALAIYADHGARVDLEQQTVQLPPDLVLEAVSHAPRFYTMGARSPAHDLVLDGTATYCATDGCGVETIDFETRERRTSTKDDVARMARVSDFLSSIGFYWPIVSAQDRPAMAPLHELDASFQNTVKHVQTETVMDAAMARYAVEMARVVAGDEETLRQRPPLSSLICTIAPLAQDEGGMESALVFAEAGLPVGFMSMANTGSTAPATLAGTVAVADAEIVAAMVLVQLAVPGAPTYHSMMPGIMHPRTGAYLGTAWEGELLYAVGVEGCTLLYPEAIVLDTDIYHRVRIDVAGFDTSPGALALDVIKEVGPRGHFLRQRHTRTHLRRRQFSDLVAQSLPGGGYREPLAVAREKVKKILDTHRPQPLEGAQQAELKRILSAAEGELGEG
jgi:trimethylamine--corrinoid protein Co-methyltransferase